MEPPIESVAERTRERMARLGIPHGTDDSTLIALGATPLPRDDPPTESRLGSCDHCERDAIVIVTVVVDVYVSYTRRGCLDHLDGVFATMANIVRAARDVTRPP